MWNTCMKKWSSYFVWTVYTKIVYLVFLRNVTWFWNVIWCVCYRAGQGAYHLEVERTGLTAALMVPWPPQTWHGYAPAITTNSPHSSHSARSVTLTTNVAVIVHLHVITTWHMYEYLLFLQEVYLRSNKILMTCITWFSLHFIYHVSEWK